MSTLAFDRPLLGHAGDPLLAIASYSGDGSIGEMTLNPLPGGLSFDGATGILSGTPAQGCVCYAELSALETDGGTKRALAAAVPLAIGGGLLLPWFHDDLARRDLQVMLRGRHNVAGVIFEHDGELRLRRGEYEELHILFRDGPLDGGLLGREPVSAGISDVMLLIRTTADYDSLPLLRVNAMPFDLAQHRTFRVRFPVIGPGIDTIFRHLDRAAGVNKLQAAFTAQGQVRWRRNGRQFFSALFPLIIAQDLEHSLPGFPDDAPGASASSSPSPSPSASSSSSPSPSPSSSPSPSPSHSPSPSPSTSPSPSPSSSPSPSPSASGSHSESASPSPSPSSSESASPSPTPSTSGTGSASASPSPTPSSSVSASPSPSPSESESASPSESPSESESASPSESPSESESPSPSESPSESESESPSESPSESESSSPSPTGTASPSPSSSESPSPSASESASESSSPSPSPPP